MTTTSSASYRLKTGLAPGLLDSLAPGKIEDFITNAFCWILSNTGFDECFLDYLSEEGLSMSALDREALRWETQTSFPRGEGMWPVRPDMTCSDGKRGIVFEHKVWSWLREDQLGDYRNHAPPPFNEAPVVLITAYPGQHQQKPDLKLCWHHIHELLEKWLRLQSDSHDPVVHFVVEDFRHLLERRGLGPMDRLEQKVIEGYFLVADFHENLKKMMWAVSGQEWPCTVERKVVDKWGRLGFQVRGKSGGTGWDPGLFVGVLLDGSDHCTEPVDRNRGPDACVVLSLDEDLHPAPAVPAYRKLVAYLKSVSFPDGWTFYDHLGDEKVREPNQWHPFHIRCPLVEVLAGARNAEEQISKFYNDTNETVRLVLEHPSLKEPWTRA